MSGFTTTLFDLSASEQHKNDDVIRFRCERCGRESTRKWRSFKRQPRKLCRACYTMCDEVRSKYHQTNLMRHGIDEPIVGHKRATKSTKKSYIIDEMKFSSKYVASLCLYCKSNGISFEKKSKRHEYSSGLFATSKYVIDDITTIVFTQRELTIDRFDDLREYCRSFNIRLMLRVDLQPFVKWVATTFGSSYLSR